MHPFQQYIQNYTAISSSEWSKIEPDLQLVYYGQKDIILTEGEVCNFLYFLEEGLLRYVVNQDGEELTKYFTIAPYCFTSQKSFTRRIPALEGIQAIEKSKVWKISYEASDKLLQLSGWNTFIRKLILEVQGYTDDIVKELQSRTAEERYSQLLINSSELLKRVPQKYLASYLGIAPQSLSRIRKKLTHENRS